MIKNRKNDKSKSILNAKNIENSRIYINNYNPINITKQLLEKLDKHLKFTKTHAQLFSSSGIYNIKNNKIFKITPKDKPIENKIFNGQKLIIDKSFFEEETIISQIPMVYHEKNITSFHYCYGEKSNLYLVIEGHYKESFNNLDLQKKELNVKEKYSNFIPENIYFLENEEIDNYLIKKELNGFLSLLN